MKPFVPGDRVQHKSFPRRGTVIASTGFASRLRDHVSVKWDADPTGEHTIAKVVLPEHLTHVDLVTRIGELDDSDA